ncbi:MULTISPECIES: DUF6238 family protein [unclassified Streptomyces]|uniref:DUF6238 family protein n=1 Tax=unclassified Streptomyces TaxID=2593676 RepID=UPI000823B002|nr:MULTISPECIES: DUF6238 family protein [unclassified Streptomyces]MYU02176.1 hypothetical protein [Streptomyces sp. SID8350]SCK61750.1 hypothetical protein YUWDRAFT_06225 [Streptomyces sp. AmelKG-D3]
MNTYRHLSSAEPVHHDSEHAPAMTITTDRTGLPVDEHAVRQDIDQLHAEALDLARRTKGLAAVLDHGDSAAAGGRVRTAVTHIWRAAEDLHTAFHYAPPRCAGPQAPMSRLCGRRMRYLAARVARRAG